MSYYYPLQPSYPPHPYPPQAQSYPPQFYSHPEKNYPPQHYPSPYIPQNHSLYYPQFYPPQPYPSHPYPPNLHSPQYSPQRSYIPFQSPVQAGPPNPWSLNPSFYSHSTLVGSPQSFPNYSFPTRGPAAVTASVYPNAEQRPAYHYTSLTSIHNPERENRHSTNNTSSPNIYAPPQQNHHTVFPHAPNTLHFSIGTGHPGIQQPPHPQMLIALETGKYTSPKHQRRRSAGHSHAVSSQDSRSKDFSDTSSISSYPRIYSSESHGYFSRPLARITQPQSGDSTPHTRHGLALGRGPKGSDRGLYPISTIPEIDETDHRE